MVNCLDKLKNFKIIRLKLNSLNAISKTPRNEKEEMVKMDEEEMPKSDHSLFGFGCP